MKKQVQKGFTLIELMIVVAIIGILASIALPAYKDYIIKSKIGGPVMTQIGGIKSNIFETYTTEGEMPPAVDITAYESALDDHDNIVAPVGSFVRTNDDVVTLDITLENVGSAVETAGTNNIQFVFDGNAATHGFTCNGAATTVPAKYLPKACK